jgi:MipA family protein
MAKNIAFGLCVWVLLMSPVAAATWEVGGGVSVTRLPDYVGSDEAEAYVLPIPYVYYRGDTWEIDRNAVHGELFRQGPFSGRLNLSGSVPVDSESNRARRGMPDIDWIGEMGPAILYHFNGNPATNEQLYIEIPVRAAESVGNGGLHHQGWILNPTLVASNESLKREGIPGHFAWQISVGALWGSAKYHHYIYGVDQAWASDERPPYAAGSGYNGTRLAMGAAWRRESWWVGTFARYIDLHGAVYEESPLVRQDYSLIAGLALVYIFTLSE